VRAAEQGGIKAVLLGCRALRNLAVTDDNRMKIAELGGIKAVMGALCQKGSAEVQEKGTGRC